MASNPTPASARYASVVMETAYTETTTGERMCNILIVKIIPDIPDTSAEPIEDGDFDTISLGSESDTD
jgi:hypothetical protein